MKYCTRTIPNEVVAQCDETSRDVSARVSMVPGNNAGSYSHNITLFNISCPDAAAHVRSIAIHSTVKEQNRGRVLPRAYIPYVSDPPPPIFCHILSSPALPNLTHPP